MKIHNLLSYTLILYVAVITASSSQELTLLQTSSSQKIEQVGHKRSSSTSELYSRLSYYPTPRSSIPYSRLSCYPTPSSSIYNDDYIDTILIQDNPNTSSFSQNGNNLDIRNQFQNEGINSYYAVNISNQRAPKTAMLSRKSVIALTFIGTLNLFKIVVDGMEIQKYYNQYHADNDNSGTLFASLGMDIASLILLCAVYQCNHNKC